MFASTIGMFVLIIGILVTTIGMFVLIIAIP